MLSETETQDIQKLLTIEYVDSFTDYGCRMTGSLAVVRCIAACDAHPRYGFNSHACYDVADIATRMILDKHPGAKKLLGVPDVVMRINRSNNQRGELTR